MTGLLLIYLEANGLILVPFRYKRNTSFSIITGPNDIGMSIVRLIRRDKNILEVKVIDILDKTPLLDIKPYMPRFDRIETASEGWIAGKEWRPKPQDRE